MIFEGITGGQYSRMLSCNPRNSTVRGMKGEDSDEKVFYLSDPGEGGN